jgi:hypothetical protein
MERVFLVFAVKPRLAVDLFLIDREGSQQSGVRLIETCARTRGLKLGDKGLSSVHPKLNTPNS